MITTVKGPTGWTAKTYIDRVDGMQLRIVTYKSQAGTISTFAEQIAPRFVLKAGIVKCSPYSDFRKTYMTSAGKCTEKKVAMQQYQVLQRLAEIKADCDAFYAAQ